MTPERLSEDLTTPLLKERIRNVFRQFPHALAGDEEAIHQLRVSGRRLRVSLPLLARRPEGKRVRRALRGLQRVTRLAGASRDLDVSVGLYQERVRGAAEPGAERRLLLRRLKSSRTRSQKRMVETLLDLEIAQLRRDLRTVVARQGESLFMALIRLRAAREEDGARALAELEAVGERHDVAALHAIRRRCRRLRYAAEILDRLKGQKGEAPGLFKQLQERIGAIHDAHVLAAWLTRQAAAAEARGAVALAAAAAEDAEYFQERSRSLHRELLAARPAELVRAALEAMGAARSAA